jgi:hypothetical protein
VCASCAFSVSIELLQRCREVWPGAPSIECGYGLVAGVRPKPGDQLQSSQLRDPRPAWARSYKRLEVAVEVVRVRRSRPPTCTCSPLARGSSASLPPFARHPPRTRRLQLPRLACRPSHHPLPTFTTTGGGILFLPHGGTYPLPHVPDAPAHTSMPLGLAPASSSPSPRRRKTLPSMSAPHNRHRRSLSGRASATMASGSRSTSPRARTSSHCFRSAC